MEHRDLYEVKKNAKIVAATSVPPTTNMDSGLMAIPRVTNVEMIKISHAAYTKIQRLGLELHSHRRSRTDWSVVSLPNASATIASVLSVAIPKPIRNLPTAHHRMA